MRDYTRTHPVWTRMIAVKDRECSECGDTVLEGTVYFKDKRLDIWCVTCVDYENEKAENDG